MILVREIDYPAFTGTEKRRLYIYLPAGYDENKKQRCPVLYMFDGHNVFFDSHATYGKSWGLGDYLDSINASLIVAALECHHGENNERLYEYSPYDFSERRFGSVTGHGKETMEYFVRSLKPVIDAEFRTKRDRKNTFIGGSSMGGLMALYAVLDYNRYFSKAAALSPAVPFCYNSMKELAKNSKAGSGTTVYMDVGAKETNAAGLKMFSEYARILMQKGIAVTARVVPDGSHCEASWERQLPFMIGTLLYDPSTGPVIK